MDTGFFGDLLIHSFNDRVADQYKRSNISLEDIPPAVRQKILTQANIAQRYLGDNDFATLWIQHRIALIDGLRKVGGYTEEDLQRRLAVTHQIQGLDSFIEFLEELDFLGKKLDGRITSSTQRRTNSTGATANKPVFHPDGTPEQGGTRSTDS